MNIWKNRLSELMEMLQFEGCRLAGKYKDSLVGSKSVMDG
jgi:hypothetical protein